MTPALAAVLRLLWCYKETEGKRDIEAWFRVRICCLWNLCWSNWIVLTPILGEGFAFCLPDVLLSDKSVEATSHMCLGVGKVFLCHWTLDQRGVKDCLCPFSIAAARGWQRPEEAPASSPFSGAGFPFPSLSFLTSCGTVCGCILSVVNLPDTFNVSKPENYPYFLMVLLLFISAEILLPSVCTHRSAVSWKSSSSSSNHVPNLV